MNTVGTLLANLFFLLFNKKHKFPLGFLYFALYRKPNGNLCFLLKRRKNKFARRVPTVFISFQGFLDLILALRFLETDKQRSVFLKRPQKFDEISQFI
jgi:hypothetical protein